LSLGEGALEESDGRQQWGLWLGGREVDGLQERAQVALEVRRQRVHARPLQRGLVADGGLGEMVGDAIEPGAA
jgi:hypothetical protein